jgi:uncharacterized protein
MIQPSESDAVLTLRPRRASREEPSLCKLGSYPARIQWPAYCEAGQLVLTAEQHWVLTGPAPILQSLRDCLPGVCEHIGGSLILAFGNRVGFADTPHLGRWKIVSGKWGPEHFDLMLEDLTKIASAIPFSANSITALPYDRTVASPEVLYHLFVYLRHVLLHTGRGQDDLCGAFNTVLREPHQRFAADRQNTPLEMARRVDEGTLFRIAAGAEPMAPAGRAAGLALARRLRGRIPERVTEVRVRPTRDTAENRFAKTFRDVCTGVIGKMRDEVQSSPNAGLFRTSVARDCDDMDRALAPIIRDAFWLEVGQMVHFPAASTVLQRRRGYRDLLRHFAQLRMAARVPLEHDTVRDLLENRDLALLYELWCFFALAGTLGTLLGRPTHADRPRRSPLALNVDWDFSVTWNGKARLYYNRGFSRSRRTAWSYSVPLRPDIALEVPSQAGPSKLHLLDAKFRLDRLDDLLPITDPEDAGSTTEAAEERRGVFKQADLYKMHTYRDALGASTVWILYPGDTARFFPTSGSPIDPGEVELPASPAGVGALPVRPADTDRQALNRVLKALLGGTGA